MKTIIKYELVINEALRSALNYNTPDEQINEFIRFFGRHIGSDRIYIFEDCKERHGTDNTYEWCAQGVTPEIDRLQNVDMDVIKWWYDTFSKGESIIITDIEDIKEEHRVSYDMLKRSQNLHKIISTHLLIMEVDFCPVLCIPEVPVLQAFRGISHFVWYCKAVSDLS